MKAAYISETGPPEIITYGDLPEPSLQPNQCLIEVSAVDVNPIDVYQRAGMIPGPSRFPHVLGRDLAGTVTAVGPGVSEFEVGERVWATNMGSEDRPGTFAERVPVDVEWLYRTPDSVKDEHVVAVSLVGVTAYLGLTQHARLKSGEVVFVNGGSGGVGSCVIQMSKARGATVIATAGTEEKARICRELGADHVINRRSEVVADRVRALAPTGVDVWWETTREPDVEKTLPLLAVRGRMIVMAGRDARPVLPVGPLYVKDCSILGFAMFNADAGEIREAADAINQWMAKGLLKARIDRVLPLSEAAEAHRLQESSTVHGSGALAGKIVLKV